jgi:hypothetical protein
LTKSNNLNFTERLEKAGFSFKPAFYLMGLSQLTDKAFEFTSILRQLSEAAREVNKDVDASTDEPTDSKFEILSVDRLSDDVFEIRLKWEVPMHYWDPRSLTSESVKSLKIGFVLVHAKARKALVSCHTITERSRITQIVSRALKFRFMPMVLTKKLLDQIGTFDTVKRAAYFFPERRPDRATNISFADDVLGSIPEVRACEEGVDAERKLSFYRIPLVGLGERGVGATSDSAKLWIPSDTPVSTVQEFGVALLENVTGTLRKMKREGDLDGLLRIVLSDANPRLASIMPLALRRDIQALTGNLIRMLVGKEEERALRPSASFLTSAVPEFFEYPQIAIFDEEAGTTAFWKNVDGSELLKFRTSDGTWTAVAYPTSIKIDLHNLISPANGSTVSIADPTSVARLLPTKKLHDLILEIIHSLAGDFPELKKVVALPFSFSSGLLRLDIERSTNSKLGALTGRTIPISEIRQLSIATNRELPAAVRKKHIDRLNTLGEKCKRMSDDNCHSCLEDRQFLCLRSLLARFMTNHLLLAHKGIELCDLQGEVSHEEIGSLRVFVFSKLSPGRKGLTLRNNSGAILVSQILGQLDKTTFETIGVLSSSTINEDLRERLVFLAGLTNKSIVFFDGPILAKMLAEFEEQAVFDGVSPDLIYKVSKSPKRLLKEGMKAPGLLAAPMT